MNKKLIIGSIAGVVSVAMIITAAVFISNSAASGTVEERGEAAKSFVEEGKLTKAANTYESILEEDSSNMEAAIGLADVYSEKGKYDEAAGALKKAIASSPDNVELYDKLMGVYRESGDTQAAFAYI